MELFYCSQRRKSQSIEYNESIVHVKNYDLGQLK